MFSLKINKWWEFHTGPFIYQKGVLVWIKLSPVPGRCLRSTLAYHHNCRRFEAWLEHHMISPVQITSVKPQKHSIISQLHAFTYSHLITSKLSHTFSINKQAWDVLLWTGFTCICACTFPSTAQTKTSSSPVYSGCLPLCSGQETQKKPAWVCKLRTAVHRFYEASLFWYVRPKQRAEQASGVEKEKTHHF